MKTLYLTLLSIFTFSTLLFFSETVSAKASGYRSSISGKYVTKGYANSHKSTTQSYRR